MACPGCAAVAAGLAMPPPWRNPQAVLELVDNPAVPALAAEVRERLDRVFAAL